jgi:ribosomal protein S18 acetylase RimI-like enzyme
MFWPPQLVAGESAQTALMLADAVIRMLDETAIEMTQALLPSGDSAAAPVLSALGFRHLAELLYMSCEAERFPTAPPAAMELKFEAYRGTQRGRLIAIVEQTYRETLDCIGLNGMRTVDDVIDGYQGTGVFRAENWQIVRAGGRDVGVLLLADHPPARHWELMYMGLMPEARGQGWGGRITEHAKWLARGAGIERIVLGVDSTNTPALRMYRAAGFEVWDRRTVHVRSPGETSA